MLVRVPNRAVFKRQTEAFLNVDPGKPTSFSSATCSVTIFDREIPGLCFFLSFFHRTRFSAYVLRGFPHQTCRFAV